RRPKNNETTATKSKERPSQPHHHNRTPGATATNLPTKILRTTPRPTASKNHVPQENAGKKARPAKKPPRRRPPRPHSATTPKSRANGHKPNHFTRGPPPPGHAQRPNTHRRTRTGPRPRARTATAQTDDDDHQASPLPATSANAAKPNS